MQTFKISFLLLGGKKGEKYLTIYFLVVECYSMKGIKFWRELLMRLMFKAQLCFLYSCISNENFKIALYSQTFIFAHWPELWFVFTLKNVPLAPGTVWSIFLSYPVTFIFNWNSKGISNFLITSNYQKFLLGMCFFQLMRLLWH